MTGWSWLYAADGINLLAASVVSVLFTLTTEPYFFPFLLLRSSDYQLVQDADHLSDFNKKNFFFHSFTAFYFYFQLWQCIICLLALFMLSASSGNAPHFPATVFSHFVSQLSLSQQCPLALSWQFPLALSFQVLLLYFSFFPAIFSIASAISFSSLHSHCIFFRECNF